MSRRRNNRPKTASRTEPSPTLFDSPCLFSLAAPFVVATLVVSVAFPLGTYVLSLAMFGLAHVLSELRYIDLKYGRSVGEHLRWVLGLLLVLVVAIRVSQLLGLLSAEVGRPLEVGVVVLLSLSVLPKLLQRSLIATLVGIAVTTLLITGLLVSPIHTLLILAILHNLTPLGFLADALPSRERLPVLIAATALFVAIPALIATGLPFEWLSKIGMTAPEASILPVGPLSAHLSAYIHPVFHDAQWAVYAFSAVVFAQCMHYAVVIHVLPRLLDDDHSRHGLVSWPDERRFLVLTVIASALLFALFVWSFDSARSLYGVAAAVHAWVEVPILMLALFAGLSATTALDNRN